MRKINIYRNTWLLIISIFVLTLNQCKNITEDADCRKQKSDESKCVRAFGIYCSGNRTLVECNGSIESIFFIGSFCKVGQPCKSNT